jgi:hypothetical protein
MKLDLNFTLKGFDGKEMESEAAESINAAQVLATQLYSAREASNPVKYFDWALKLYNKQTLEVDSSDLEELKKFVKTHKSLFVIAQAQILKALSSLESDGDKSISKKTEDK